LSDSHNEELLVKNQAKVLRWVKATRFARQGSLAGHAGAGLILSRNPAMDRLGYEPRLLFAVCACACKRICNIRVDTCQIFPRAYKACIIGAGVLAAPQHFKVFTLLQTRNTLQTLVL
jgi:hypothetical protein